MIEITFIYQTQNHKFNYPNNGKMENICKKLGQKLKLNYNDLLFIYNSKILETDKSFKDVANIFDKECNKMNILVVEKKKKEIRKEQINEYQIQINKILEIINTVRKNIESNENNNIKEIYEKYLDEFLSSENDIIKQFSLTYDMYKKINN